MDLNKAISAQNQATGSQPGNESIKYSKIIDKVFSSVNDHLLVLINQMLNTADNKLFDLAEKATSDEEQMKYMDCTEWH